MLPTDNDLAQEITLIRNEFALKDKVLYHLEKDGTLRLVPLINTLGDSYLMKRIVWVLVDTWEKPRYIVDSVVTTGGFT